MEKLLTKKDSKDSWKKALNNELCRLANGYENITGTKTIKFTHKKDIFLDRKVTYSNFECDVRPHKKKAYIVKMTVVGDKLDYS